MKLKKIGFATYSKAPDLIPEDRPLIAVLHSHGVEAIAFDWERPLPPDLQAVVVRSCWNSHYKPREFINWLKALECPVWNPLSVIGCPKEGDFRVQLEWGGRLEPLSPPPHFLGEAKAMLSKANGLDWLYARVDVVHSQGRLLLMEIEAIDPMLYFEGAPGARERFARAIVERI